MAWTPRQWLRPPPPVAFDGITWRGYTEHTRCGCGAELYVTLHPEFVRADCGQLMAPCGYFGWKPALVVDS
jgi:hypothetical protein